MNTVIVACALTGLVSADPDPVKPVSPERIKELVEKLEVPTRGMADPKSGPPEGAPPRFSFRTHPELFQIARAGEAARPVVFALLDDKSKPGQARAHAAMVLVEWLLGKGAKQEVDPKVLAALKGALKDKDATLRWGVLYWASRYGKANAHERFATAVKALPNLDRDSLHFSDATMDELLPEVIAALADEHPEVAESAANTIYCFGRPKSGVPELLAALRRKEPNVRALAAAALGRVGPNDPDALKAVLEELNHPERYQDRDHYRSIIGAVGAFGRNAKDAVPALIKVIESSEWKRHEHTRLYDAAIHSLGEIGPDAKTAIPAILKYAECVRLQSELITDLDKIERKAGDQARDIEKRKQDEFKRQLESLRNKPPPTLEPPRPPIKP